MWRARSRSSLRKGESRNMFHRMGVACFGGDVLPDNAFKWAVTQRRPRLTAAQRSMAGRSTRSEGIA